MAEKTRKEEAEASRQTRKEGGTKKKNSRESEGSMIFHFHF